MKRAGAIRITGGDLRGRELRVPPGIAVRPMRSRIRESLFGVIGDRLAGAIVLDGFAGSGAIGVEAVSRGAWRAVHAETDRTVLAQLQKNLDRLQLRHQCEVVPVDLYDGASSGRLAQFGAFRLIFLDPPFGDYSGQNAERNPWALAERLARDLLEDGGWIGLESPSHVTAPTPPSGLAVEFERTYGDTSIVIWRRVNEIG